MRWLTATAKVRNSGKIFTRLSSNTHLFPATMPSPSSTASRPSFSLYRPTPASPRPKVVVSPPSSVKKAAGGSPTGSKEAPAAAALAATSNAASSLSPAAAAVAAPSSAAAATSTALEAGAAAAEAAAATADAPSEAAPSEAAAPSPSPEELALAAQQAAEALAAKEANGVATLRYNHYIKEMEVKDGAVTSLAVDSLLSLSFVYKFCWVHLVEALPEEATAPSGAKAAREFWVPEQPGEESEAATCRSTVLAVKAGHTYWAIVEEDSKEKAAADAKAAASLAEFLKKQEAELAAGGGSTAAKARVEGCSCLYVSAQRRLCDTKPQCPPFSLNPLSHNTHAAHLA